MRAACDVSTDLDQEANRAGAEGHSANIDLLSTRMQFFDGVLIVMMAILKGILEGLIAKELPLVVLTRDEAEASYELLRASIQDFKQGKGEEAIQELAQAMTSLVAGALAETKQLMKAIEQMNTPATFVYHVNLELLLNGVDTLQRMGSATKNFLSWQWEKFGEDVGSILADLVGYVLAFLIMFVSLRIQLMALFGAAFSIERIRRK